MRFDEVELLEPVTFETDAVEAAPPPEFLPCTPAPRFRRLCALLVDLSLFAALALALSPLLPAGMNPLSVAALAGFVILVSYYYFVGSWMVWGKTIGGTIFDVRVVPDASPAMSLRTATLRFAGLYLGLLTAGIGLMLAALPSRRSLPDRMSSTQCVAAL